MKSNDIENHNYFSNEYKINYDFDQFISLLNEIEIFYIN